MMTAPKSPYITIVVMLLVSIFSGAAIQVAAGLLWGGKLVARVDQLEQRNKEQDIMYEKLDMRGSQQLPLVEQRLKNLEETVRHNTTRIDTLQLQGANISQAEQALFDSLRRDVQRLENDYKRLQDQDKSRLEGRTK